MPECEHQSLSSPIPRKRRAGPAQAQAGPAARVREDGRPPDRDRDRGAGQWLVTGLRQAHKDRGDDPSVAETAELLYGTALLAEGGALEDPARFAELLADRLARTV